MQRTDPDRVWLTGAGLLLAALAAGCKPTGPPVDRDVEQRESMIRQEEEGLRKEWREGNALLPPYPREEHLMQVELSGPTTFSFLVDTESIRIDGDGVVRYTLIARSSAGSDTVSFEGMRCETSEFKPYAFGSVDQTWTAARDAGWNPIRSQSLNNYRAELYRFYFCPYGKPQRDAGRAVAALKHGIPHPPGR